MMRKGTQVSWQWGTGHGEGQIVDVFHQKVTRKLQGTEVTRNGTQDNPAYLIEQTDGDQVLKLSSEVESA